MFDIEDFAWQHASSFTEEAEKRHVLEWFVNRVRDGKTINPAVMEFIAAGVERYLEGKKPWGAKQGVKKKSPEQALRDALPIYAAYQRIGAEYLAHRISNKSDAVGYVIVTTAEEFGISEDTVKRALDTVKKHRWTMNGKLVYDAWEIEQFFKRWVNSPEGKAFLETPEGREIYKDSPFVHGKKGADT